jgi:hypothetical protein
MSAANHLFSEGALMQFFRMQMGHEDAGLRKLASQYAINIEETDWLRSLALCLAIEHVKGFYQSIGGTLTTLNWSLLHSKAQPRFPKRRGAPSKRFLLNIRQDRLLTDAAQMRAANPYLSTKRIAEILSSKKYVIPGDLRPLSSKVLYRFLLAGERRHRKSLARVESNVRRGSLLLGTILDGGNVPSKST